MLRYAARRLLWSIPILLIASVLVFVAVKNTTDPGALRGPGHHAPRTKPVVRPSSASTRAASSSTRRGSATSSQGDFGESLKTSQPVWPDLKTAIWNTIQLGIFAFVISITLGVAIGTLSAVRQYSWFDSAATGVSFVGLSIPPFFFGLILQIVLVLQFQEWFGDTPVLHVAHELAG